ncbi:MAG: HDOD domain-containing protein [Gammaproteobacteria bacterium]|nr:HDOD domain-containing protein [Gammaproteobacteria bacterium]
MQIDKEVIFKNDQLPIVPNNLQNLLNALSDDDLDFITLAKILSEFPSVSARLISVANSAWAAPKVEITHLEDACSRLGLKIVRSIAISLTVAAPFNPQKCPEFIASRFWADALLTADIAFSLTPLINSDVHAKTIHTIGLLQSLGLLWLADNMNEITGVVLNDSHTNDASIAARLQQQVGTHYHEIGFYLAESWGFPKVLQQSILNCSQKNYSGEFSEYAQVVYLALQIVARLNKELEMEELVPLAETLGIQKVDFEKYCEGCYNALDSMRELANTLFR